MLHLCQMFSKIKTALDAYQSHKPTSSVSFRMDAPQCEKYWFAVNLVQSNYSKTETDVRDDQQCLDSFLIFRDTCFMLQEQMFWHADVWMENTTLKVSAAKFSPRE